MGIFSRLAGVPLEPAVAADFARETAEVNRRRMRLLTPIMVILHLLHIAFFWVGGATRATLTADVLRWRDSLVVAHAVMVPVAATLLLLAYRGRDFRITRWLGPAVTIAYLEHGAVVAGIDQIVSSNISVYIGYCFGLAMVVSLNRRMSLFAYALGAATLIVSLFVFQRDAHARLTNLPTCMTLTIVSIGFAWYLWGARKSDYSQRLTIDRQRDELAALNATLSQRVQEQVAEIMDRAAEVDRLNVQLRGQVRARSNELSLALGKLASQRNTDGSLPPGLVLGNRFAVAERLGAGGMGTVYAGIDRSTEARVAIKVIQANSSDQLDAMRRFIREVGVAATVAHPAVVRMLHLDVSDDGLLFQAQELVDGETLAAHAGRRWPAAEAARLGAVLCEALAAAHAEGVVHRDVKPDNVMLTLQAPGMKLLDFGIAKLIDALSQPNEHTAVRMVIGTPGYMAPEQAVGKDAVTDRADVFAVGVMLFQLLTGKLPVDKALVATVALAEPSLPKELMDEVVRCLEDAPEKRPSAAALAAALRAYADAHQAPALEAIVRSAVAADRSPLEAQVTTPNRPGAASNRA